MATLPTETRESIYHFYGISRIGLESGSVWQFFTYGFIHGGPLHLFLNMFGLFLLGCPVEKTLGVWRFTLLYFLALIGGAVGQLLLVPNDGFTLIGASGAVFGVVLAFTTIYRDNKVFVLLFFVLPLSLRARYLGWLLFGISLFMVVMRWQLDIGHAAHLAGCVIGYLYARALGFGGRRKTR